MYTKQVRGPENTDGGEQSGCGRAGGLFLDSPECPASREGPCVVPGTRLLCPWAFPGKSTGVGCHCLSKGNGYQLLYTCLENSMDCGAWQATAHGVAKSQPLPLGSQGWGPPVSVSLLLKLGHQPWGTLVSQSAVGSVTSWQTSGSDRAVEADPVPRHRWQPTRPRSLWGSLGKNTGVGCHFLLPCMKVKSEKPLSIVHQAVCLSDLIP